MSEESVVQKLVDQCKSNDVDVKVDALTKLQAEFERGAQIPDVDGMIEVVKTCLRSSNLHLTTATLSALPPLLPLLVSTPLHHATQPLSSSSSTSSTTPTVVLDLATLRHLLTALLPQGGLFERLGDREKPQAKAREALVVLGGLAFRAPNGPTRPGSKTETPLMIFERFLRESGLGSKAWKVREQSILALAHIRRKHHLFPFRPYLPLLVASLEDTDAHVRETAKSSVIELFTGPGASDSARADLKKELMKKGVRKTIVDTVLSKVLGGAPSTPLNEGSENGDSQPPQPYLPPSLALAGRRPTGSATPAARSVSSTIKSAPTPVPVPAPAPVPAALSESTVGGTSEVQPVYIASARDLETEFAGMQAPFEGKETEHNWAAREQAILRVRGMIKGEAHIRYEDVFLAALKDGFIQWSLKTLTSLRTTVCINTCLLYSELAAALGHAFDPLCETVLSNLLAMSNYTKRIAAQQSQLAFTAVLTNTSAQPRLVVPLLYNVLQEKSAQARTYAIAHVKDYLISHGQLHKATIEASGTLDTLDKMIRKALSDANPAVKDGSRAAFWAFEAVWQERGQAIFSSLDTLASRQLEKACPNAEAATRLQTSAPAPPTKKSSIAAAIAASRAKAKAIANAPPTLRHQATATSHAVRATSPPPRRTVSPSSSPPRKSVVSPVQSTSRPSSPLRPPGSPPTTSSRLRDPTTSSMMRSVSAGNISSSVTTPTALKRSASPTMPSSGTSTFKRRTSSPLTPSVSRLSITQIAADTALPGSPPSSVILTASPPKRSVPARLATVIADPRASLAFPDFDPDEDLMRASAIPIPHDSESEDGSNPLSFSAAFERDRPFSRRPPSASKSNSQARSSPKSQGSQDLNLNKHEGATSNALSTPSRYGMDASTSTLGQSIVVEDALRARAEQAESAAERLLELVEPDEDGDSTMSSSSLANSVQTPRPKGRPTPPVGAPVTPMNKNTAILKQVAMFKNSPAHNGGSLRTLIQDQRHETGWWLKRVALLGQDTPLKNGDSSSDRAIELKDLIASLESGQIDVSVFKRLALLSSETTVNDTFDDEYDTQSPFLDLPSSSAQSEFWNQNKNFSRLFRALKDFCSQNKDEEELEYALILLWELLENQAPFIEGREADVFELLLEVRDCNHVNVLEATNTIRDALTTRIDPVYGLTTMHATLRAFSSRPNTDPVLAEIRSSTCAFALIALGKFILRLPAEILEEELPRIRTTMISSLNDQSSLVVRESAAAALISAQVVLRDESNLFALLEGLADEKKNLLTYLFDKHSVRGVALNGKTGMEKLEKELKRLDTKTSTPPRSSLRR